MEPEECNIEQLPELIQKEIEAFVEDCPAVKAQFHVIDRIGEGTFSTVYKAHRIDDPTALVALKRIYLISSPLRIDNEARFLYKTGGLHNVVKLLGGLRHQDQVVLVLEYFEHTKIQDLLTTITEYDIRAYMRSLFEALAFIHKCHVIHRDVKPTNFLYNRELHRGYLVDFGLAQEGPAYFKSRQSNKYNTTSTPAPAEPERDTVQPLKDANRLEGSSRPNPDDHYSTRKQSKTVFAPAAVLTKSKPLVSSNTAVAGKRSVAPMTPPSVARTLPFDSATERTGRTPRPVKIPLRDSRPKLKAPRAGTRGFRAPEILLKVTEQSGAVDMWSAGIVLLILITGRYPFFIAHDDMYSLYELRLIFGHEAMRAAAAKMGRVFAESQETCSHVASPLTPNGTVDWRAFCERVNPAVTGKYPEDMYDLLGRLLMLDPNERITAKHAYLHTFIQPVTELS